MSYSGQLVILPNTYKTTPTTLLIDFPPCRVTEIWMLFPSGCAGLVGVQVYFQSRQILPFNQGAYYVSSGTPIIIKTAFDISEEPFAIEFQGYNEDDTYPHTVYINISIEFEGDMEALKQFLQAFISNQPILEEKG